MIIGIDASRANRKFKTGTEWYGYHVIQALKKIPLHDGDCFILYSPDKLQGDLKQLPKGWKKKQLYWPFKYLWTQIRLCLEMAIHPPDVLFVPSHTIPFFCRTKSVITIHDICFEKHPQFYSLFVRLYHPLVHRREAKASAHIIVPSHFTKQQLIELYKVPEKKITVIPLSHDRKNYYFINNNRAIVERVLHKYKIEQPYFLFVGRLENKKNIAGLIQAYKKLTINNPLSAEPTGYRQQLTIPDLVLVGKPGYGYKRIKNYELRIKNVQEIGYVEEDDLKYLYNGAEAFIFPSLCEGFGIPVLEAMACGCPVLASKIGSIPEVGGTAILYFNPHNIDSITNAMRKIITDKILAKELRRKGLERVNNFSWKKCAQGTMSVLLDNAKI